MLSSCASSTGFGPSVDGVASLAQSASVPTMLVKCPRTPNCVSSIATNPEKLVAPFELLGAELTDFQAAIVSAIKEDGGVVRDERKGYVWATYTSKVFRFVDDIEWLFDANKGVFDVRSASRVGRSDFGVNAKRVARLREILNP